MRSKNEEDVSAKLVKHGSGCYANLGTFFALHWEHFEKKICIFLKNYFHILRKQQLILQKIQISSQQLSQSSKEHLTTVATRLVQGLFSHSYVFTRDVLIK